MCNKIILLFVVLTAVCFLQCHSTGPTHGKVVMCYLATWATYRPGEGKFDLTDLDPSLCTHVVYIFAGLDENMMTIKSIDSALEKGYSNAGYQSLAKLKERFPHLKIILSVGGWNEGTTKYSKMAADSNFRAKFIQSTVEFLKLHQFDGLDMHWKYPVVRDDKPEDRPNFVSLIKELKQAFTPHSLILTAALGATKYTLDQSYDLPQLDKYIDYFNVLCYDYHGSWEGVIGVNAALYGVNDNDFVNVDYTLKYLLSHQVTPGKIILGLAFFGHGYILKDPVTPNIEFGITPISTQSWQGPLSKESGFMGYNEICKELSEPTSKWVRHWDEKTATPYLRDGARVITYDNPRSIALKVKKAVEYNLGGVMAWSVDTDDFRGLCEKEADYVSVSYSTLWDFAHKYNRIANNPVLEGILKNRNLPSAARLDRLTDTPPSHTDVVTRSKNRIWLSESETSNYALLHTIDDVMHLALEEKGISDEMIKLLTEKAESGGQNSTSVYTMVCYFCFI
ncbi:PREDICTED: probable chitinase 2 [Papilio xuthus]|uniref:Probable chitinase 2 n=1 Tax=Papilio xuthus TaxID=66420 RepID=A0AAJ6ZNM7_PAPXU|nr:PREDICTED: probable chitinase 2 [Papilio xuthus]XP_013176362.1 PREDICTED: probable chitinase 2 [Papilio xuthus]